MLSEKHRGKILTEEHKQKIAESGRGQKRSVQTSKNISAKMSRPCTVDGVTIYPSRTLLIEELGSGKYGSRHPDFRFV